MDFAKGLVYPPPIHVEQSSSEWTGRYKAKCKPEIIIDGTGGFGVDSYFFAKEGIELWYVEANPDLCRITQNNFDILGIDAKVICDTIEHFLVSHEGLKIFITLPYFSFVFRSIQKNTWQ